MVDERRHHDVKPSRLLCSIGIVKTSHLLYYVCACTSLQVSPVYITIVLASAVMYTDTLYDLRNRGQIYG